MKHFELVKEYAYPSGSVYVFITKKKISILKLLLCRT